MTEPVKPVKTVKTVKTIAQVIAEHQDDPQNPHGGGVLATCTCGEVYDWMPDHQQEHILKECFPHLADLHADLIASETGWLSKRYYKDRTDAYTALEEHLCEWTEKAQTKDFSFMENTRGPEWVHGFRDAAKAVSEIIRDHDV